MKNYVFVLALLISYSTFSQEADSVVVSDSIETTDTIVSAWRKSTNFGLNGSQSSFVNWNAGGRNNVTLIVFSESSAVYTCKKFKWTNDLGAALGGLQFIGKGSGDEVLQKTDDRIELATKFSRAINPKKNLFLTINGAFKTQFLDGFQNPNDSARVSTFMAPGYLNFGLGIDYMPNDNFSMLVSPLAAKITYVNDETLANEGAFGVEAAEYDLTTGQLLKKGERRRDEFGAYFKMKFKKELFKNIHVAATMDLFTNYLDRPENVDVNADVLMTFKVNSWCSASLNFTLKYDHDIMIEDAEGNVGPRTQFKSVLGLGISHSLANFEEKK